MKEYDRKYWFLVTLLIFTAVVSWHFYFKNYYGDDEISIHAFPKDIGHWTSTEQKITDDEYAILETRNAFARKYTASTGEVVYLFIVYSKNNRKVSHPPEVCYIGSGYSVLDNMQASFKRPNSNEVIRTNRLVLEFGNSQQIAYYWFRVGNTYTSNYLKQQILIAWKTLIGRPSSSALIRISTDVIEADQKHAEEIVSEFARMILPYVEQYLP